MAYERSGPILRIHRTVLVWLLLSIVGGCATYTPVGKVYRNGGARLEVELPKDWLRFTPGRPAYVITRDGLRLEKISIRMVKMGKKLPGTDRRYQPDMLPHEIAELSLGLIESSDKTSNFQVERIELARVAEHDGYKASALFTDKGGLRKHLYLYGAAIRGHVCEFRYEAAATVYFDKYVDTFEHLVTSARSF